MPVNDKFTHVLLSDVWFRVDVVSLPETKCSVEVLTCCGHAVNELQVVFNKVRHQMGRHITSPSISAEGGLTDVCTVSCVLFFNRLTQRCAALRGL